MMVASLMAHRDEVESVTVVSWLAATTNPNANRRKGARTVTAPLGQTTVQV